MYSCDKVHLLRSTTVHVCLTNGRSGFMSLVTSCRSDCIVIIFLYVYVVNNRIGFEKTCVYYCQFLMQILSRQWDYM